MNHFITVEEANVRSLRSFRRGLIIGMFVGAAVAIAGIATTAKADGLTDVPEYTSPCAAPLLDRRAYMGTVVGAHEEGFYTFYRIRRLELCGNALSEPGIYVPPSTRIAGPPAPHIPTVRPPHWPTIFPPVDCLSCGGGSNPPPVVVVPPVEPPPAPVPLPAAILMLFAAVGSLFAVAGLSKRRNRA